MADNVSLKDSTEATFSAASDDISGVQHQKVKVEFGADGTATQVSSSDPMPVTIISGSSSATEYTEDAAAAANPVGGALIMVRDDALSGQTTTDGDNVAARGTDKGELYVKHTDAIPVTDNSSSLTVDGTVTAELSATDNTVLDNIDADTSAIQTAVQLIDDGVATTGSAITTKGMAAAGTDGTNARILKTDTSGELQVDVLSIAAGTNNIGDVDVASIAAGDNNIGNVDVVTLPSIPAGTNAIGKLAANSGVDIGDVDVTSVIPGTGATNLGKAADSIPGATDTGVVPLAIRTDTPGTITPANGDYAPLRVDESGFLYTVIMNGAIAVTPDEEFSINDGGNVISIDSNVLHDATDAQGPVKIGGYASATAPSDVSANGDRVNAWFLRNGAQATALTSGGALVGATDDSAMPATPATIPVSGEYRSSATTYADGDATVLQTDVNGNVKSTLATQLAGEDLTNDVIKTEQRFSNTYIATATTTTVKSGAGFLHAITIGETAAGAITVYDNTAGSGTILAVLKASIAEQTFLFDISFATGLTIVTAGASKLSVSYR